MVPDRKSVLESVLKMLEPETVTRACPVLGELRRMQIQHAGPNTFYSYVDCYLWTVSYVLKPMPEMLLEGWRELFVKFTFIWHHIYIFYNEDFVEQNCNLS